eukprot:CAMPEP_0118943522 /NCGR_PEP_ID=MMETSP1169-20130426/38491_1 /TAXON_ID=36882 /ORGANISM="Pyramimonas obovata, Strain CCMP722" /LENGTH=32 /DNA_ID= /DNA_START= /DNA_END= /DNA_ORIENTATION=
MAPPASFSALAPSTSMASVVLVGPEDVAGKME